MLIGFVVHFWIVPQKGLSENDLAAARVARMEVSAHVIATSQVHTKHDASHILKKLKATQAKQMEYLTIFVMLLGGTSLLYSFIKKPKED